MLAPALKKRLSADYECACLQLAEGCESGVDLALSASL
jgi:hypothetical protein